MSSLSGKVILVTGASRGIGAAAAMALAQAGASVMLTARDGALTADVARGISDAGGTAASAPCDVSDYNAVAALVDATEKKFGKIDALINNAGVIEPIATIADSDPAIWARNIEINLVGAYNPIRALLPRMIAAGGGTIVNVSSGAAIRPLEGWSAYCSGKAGLAMLTRAIALETQAQGIRVFGFQPGTTDTDMQVQIRASGINIISKIPRENLIPVAHPATAIVYLCTPAADDLNGREFSLRDDDFRQRLNLGGLTMPGPLHGVKVIEIGQALAGPLAGVIMADLGADVIKVEKPDGGDDARLWGPPFVDGDSVSFHSNNRSKRSITLDIKNAADVAKLKMLVRDADILIQNLRPGIVDAFGIGPADLRAENPRLIYCSIWAFGHSGPLRMAPGFDPLLQCYGAVVSLTGRPEDPPTFCAPAINDTATGMWCVIGALAALKQREATGLGCVVDTSLFESAVAWVQGPLNAFNVTGNKPKRHGAASATLAPYQIFETADRPICIAAGNDRLFVKLARAMGHPAWCDDPRFANGRVRSANREALVGAMQPVLLEKSRRDWLGIIGEAGVPVAPVNDIAELAETEQLRAMDMMRTLPGSGMRVVGLPLSFDRQRPHPTTDSPKLGQHNADILGA